MVRAIRSILAAGKVSGGQCIDLTTTVEPTLFLLGDTRAWRQRLVETFTYRDAAHVRVTSSYQIELSQEFLERFVTPGAQRVNVILPMTTRPKQALIGFDIETGDGGEGFLLPRRAGAEVQTTHLLQLRDTSQASVEALDGLTSALLYAMSVFTPGTWEEFQANADDTTEGLSAYLEDGLGFTITREHIARWSEDARVAGSMLPSAIEEPPTTVSASENVLLALPGIEPLPACVEEVDTVVRGYVGAVRALAAAGDEEMLGVLGEYGRRWEMLVEAEVPTYRPTIIRLGEDRPAGIGPSGKVLADISLGDAASVHLQVRVDDPNVVLTAVPEITDPVGQPVWVPLIEAVRVTDESLSLYSSHPDRPYYVRVGFTLQPSAHLRRVAHGVLAMTVSAIVATLLLNTAELTGRLALVLLPSTFAVAFVLAREETPLAATLLARHRRRLTHAVAVLWILAVVRLLAAGTLVPEALEVIRRAAEWIRW